MHLTSVEITDFLSIKGTVRLPIDSRVTVLLGSNDHGKSNMLYAIQHLNEDRPITRDEVNWDASGPTSISFLFTLTEEEKDEWAQIQGKHRLAPVIVNSEEEVDKLRVLAALGETQQAPGEARLPYRPPQLTFSRVGVDSGLHVEGHPIGESSADVQAFLKRHTPRVELFETTGAKLQDSVSSSEIIDDGSEFMQGIFFYAGINPFDCAELFQQTDPGIRSLELASKKLDENLRDLWAQGTDLHFYFRHRGDRIELFADDPAVKNRPARMSKRSGGVTQFFRISMLLHARREKHPANSYIFLFDEPGVFLHPQGQRDLLQVFERLAGEAQILYVTHSIFMLNQNFPERHMLISKDENGTNVDSKPYRKNWRLATDALGVFLTSNILFSSKVLLVEGDSDPIYIYELLRQLNKLEQTDADANSLGIFSFYDYHNLRFLLQVFTREGQSNKVLVLVDGDKAGRLTLEEVKPLCDRLKVECFALDPGKSIEDYCLSKKSLLEAVAKTIETALDAEEIEKPADLKEQIQASWRDNLAKTDRENAGRWFSTFAKTLLGKKGASKVGLARNYVSITRDLPKLVPESDDLHNAKTICNPIISKLELPETRARKAITA